MFKHDHWVWVQERRFQQTLHIGRIGRVDHFDAFDTEQVLSTLPL